MNICIITGRLGKPCEERFTAAGKKVVSFSVANDIGWGDNKQTQWVNCAIFGKLAEGGLPQYLVKGTQVSVQGEVKARAYVNKSGEAVGSLDLIVRDIELMGGKSDSKPEVTRQPTQTEKVTVADFEDEIPF